MVKASGSTGYTFESLVGQHTIPSPPREQCVGGKIDVPWDTDVLQDLLRRAGQLKIKQSVSHSLWESEQR